MEAFLQYLTFPFLLEGMWLTLRIFAASMVGGLALGLLIALMRLSPYRLLSGLAWTYVWLIRGTPVLLQLVFLFDDECVSPPQPGAHVERPALHERVEVRQAHEQLQLLSTRQGK